MRELAEPGAHRLPDHRLQPAAVDGELRDVIACVGPAQLAPDLLPEPVGVEQLVGSDAHGVEPLEQPELRQLLDRMRQGIDADAELADGVRLFVDFAVDTARMQHQRGGQAANAAPDDDDFHGSTRKKHAHPSPIMVREAARAQRFSPDVVDGPAAPVLPRCRQSAIYRYFGEMGIRAGQARLAQTDARGRRANGPPAGAPTQRARTGGSA